MRSLLSLTENQRTVLDLAGRGLSFADLARKLGVSKQHIQQTFRVAESIVYRGLMDVAQANQVEVRRVDSAKSILWGYQPWLGKDVIITFLPSRGVRVWYWTGQPEEVKDKALLENATNYLLEEARRAGLSLSEEEKRRHPGKLAQTIFSRLIPEMST